MSDDGDDFRESQPLLDLSSSRRSGRSPVAVCAWHQQAEQNVARIFDELGEMRTELRDDRRAQTEFRHIVLTALKIKGFRDDGNTPNGTLRSNSSELAVGPVKYRGRTAVVWAALGALVVIAIIGGVAWVEGNRVSHVTATVAPAK
jgi:hypothetical protein